MTGSADHVQELSAAAPSCRNCEAPLHGPYCAHCGQDTNTHRRSLADLLADIISDVASFDSRMLRTSRALLLRPGELPLAFHQGRMQPYVPAIRLYFFVTLVFFLVLGVTNIAILQLEVKGTATKIVWDSKGNPFIVNPSYDKDESDVAAGPKLIPIPKSRALQKGGLFTFGTEPFFFARLGSVHSVLTATQRAHLTQPLDRIDDKRDAKASWIKTHLRNALTRLAADPGSINAPLTTWIPRALFLLLPLYAVILALVQWRRRKDYFFVDHLVFSLNIHTFAFVALLVAAGLAQIVSGGIVALLLILALGAYIFLAMKRFYRQSWLWTFVKFATVSTLYVLFCLVPALLGVLVLSFFGGSIG